MLNICLPLWWHRVNWPYSCGSRFLRSSPEEGWFPPLGSAGSSAPSSLPCYPLALCVRNNVTLSVVSSYQVKQTGASLEREEHKLWWQIRKVRRFGAAGTSCWAESGARGCCLSSSGITGRIWSSARLHMDVTCLLSHSSVCWQGAGNAKFLLRV